MAPVSGTERLAKLEAEWLPDAPQHNGRVERGVGSAYSQLSPEQRSHYEAVLAVIDAEAEVAYMRKQLADAEEDLALAQVRADATDPNRPAEQPVEEPVEEPAPAGPEPDVFSSKPSPKAKG